MNQALIFAKDDLPWAPVGPGIEMKILHADETTGCWTIVNHMHAGSTLPPHRHLGASEFYIIEGEGNQVESGDFKPGDYMFEHEGAVHSALHVEQDVYLYMVSYGAGQFLKADGSTLYVGGATFFWKQMGNGVLDVLARKIKYFLFIYMWKKMQGRG